jgi:hypothetical protein
MSASAGNGDARWTPERLVDLTRYPVLELEQPATQALIARGRAALADDGLCLLGGFVAPAALGAMAAEAQSLVPGAFRRDQMNGVWRYDADEAEFPADHPRRARHLSRHGTIAYDRLAPSSPIRALYEWPGLTDLIAALSGEPRLYNCADPLASCVITVLGEGDAHAWHYDSNDFVVSLLLQDAEEGGLFEYAPNIRTDEDENYGEIARLFAGETRRLKVARLEPGGLALFRGQRSLHRVTRVKGRRDRLIALFSYDRKPGMMFDPEVHRRALGRSLAAA